MRSPSHAHTRVDRGTQLVLSTESLRGFPASAAHRTAGIAAAREPTKRAARAARPRTRGRFGQPVAPGVGDSLPQAPELWGDPDDVRLVRGTAELPHGNGLSRRRLERSMAGP